MKKIIFIAVGYLCVALAAIGAIIPLLPSVPFLMLGAFCFLKSSKRLHCWFTGTKLYKNNLESYMQKKAMTMRTKIRIITFVSMTMLIGYVMMSRVPIGRIVLIVVWIIHIGYFIFGVKTIKNTKAERRQKV